MGASPGPALVECRDAVTGSIWAGCDFNDVEKAIDRLPLGEDERASLWLLAHTLRDWERAGPGAATSLAVG